MAYFHCLIGGGSSGGGYELTVTCDADFAGTTITATDGVTTLTKTCPSASPYEVVFAIPNGGEWTISGTISGQTYSTAIDIPDSLELHSVPEGSTVLPTDDIQTWLKCAGITDKSYTTLNEVLADSTTLLALISDNNAVDYLVRSTTWASGLTADSTAMTDIGANNYCANTLLSDSTWAEAICNSTYFESVLNVKVPTLKADSTSVISNMTPKASGFEKWKVFDGNTGGNGFYWTYTAASSNAYVGYNFGKSVNIYRSDNYNVNNTASIKQAKIQYSDDGSTWTDATELFNNTLGAWTKVLIPTNAGAHQYWCIGNMIDNGDNTGAYIFELQFYGREDV